ncbi:MAG: ATP-binding protein [Vicinamibacterales bacterium]
MAVGIRHIATRLVIFLAGAAVLPLVAYGFVSLISLQRGTQTSVGAGNLNVATRAAEEIRRYITGNADILRALAADLQDSGLDTWQQDRILKNYVLQFREYREITLFDQSGAMVATSRVGQPRVGVPENPAATINNVVMSPIRLDAEELPTAVFAVPLRRLGQPSGWLVGEINLEEMWRMVDQIRIGERGYALVVGPDGTLIAHGNPDRKALIAQAQSFSSHPLVTGPAAQTSQEYRGDDGEEQLGVAAPIETLGWTVVVEQPTEEAYASATALQRQLLVVIGVALLVMIGFGLWSSRQFLNPIFSLQRATTSVAAGNLQTRVAITTRDEFADLGNSFNRMADRLVELQEDVKRQERQAMFGRIAAGLFHDLAHPIQNIGNSTKLLMRDDLDAESRTTFHKTIERELASLRRFMDDLRNVAKPKPIERFPVDVNVAMTDMVEAMRPEAQRVEVALEGNFARAPVIIEGDRFALDRVYRNLISNAIQATPPGGRVSVVTRRTDDRVEIVVEDTGSGISADRLPRIFDDFVTTKRRGLGLGLAISKRIVEQLEGTIAVESEVGRGTVFTLRFPARDDLRQAAAS